MGSTAELSASEFEALTAKIKQLMAKIEAKIDQAVTTIGRVLSVVPDSIAGNVKQALRKLDNLTKEFIKKIEPFVFHPGSPAVWVAANEWSAVAGKATTLFADLDAGKAGANDNWKGTAATAYESVRASQQKAVGGIRTAANAIGDSLNATTIALAAFYAALAASVATVLGALVALIVASAPVATIPATTTAAVAVVVAEIGFVATLVGGGLVALASVKSQQTKIMGALASEGLGGSWPTLRPGGPDISDDANWAVKDPKG